jgi:anti-repressor protein
MSNITLFDFNSSTIRVVNVDGEPWFVASDICKILELDNVSMATNRLDGDERGVISLSDTLGTEQNYTIINESGFYSLVLGSRKLVAKPFKNWVTKEVLPSIRRTGKYESEKAKLEQQFLPKVSIKEIDDAAALFGKRFGLAYEQRYVLQQFNF